MLRACDLPGGKRAEAVPRDADRRSVRLQRRRTTGVPRQSVVACPVSKELGLLSFETVARAFRPANAASVLTAGATRADKSASRPDKRAPRTDLSLRAAPNPHLSLTTSPRGRDVLGAVCETSQRRGAQTIFGPSRARRSPVRNGYLLPATCYLLPATCYLIPDT